MDYAEIVNITPKRYNKGFVVIKDKLTEFKRNSSYYDLKIQGVQLLDGSVYVGDMIVAVKYLEIVNIGHIVNIYECEEFNKKHPNDKNLFTIEIDPGKYIEVYFDKNYKLMVLN